MKKIDIPLIMLTVIFLLSCSSQKKNEASEHKEQRLQQAGLLEGIWLSDTYLSRIEETKSIYDNQNYVDSLDWFGFTFSGLNLQTDSAKLYGFTLHEGGYDAPLAYDPEKNKFINNLNAGTEALYCTEPFEIEIIDSNLIELYFPTTHTRERYRRSNNEIEIELMRTLIAGSYIDTKNNAKIQFDSTGKVYNFKNFVSYDLLYDFEDTGIDFDAITFYTRKDKWNEGTTYKFSIRDKTLYLELVETNWETLDHKVTKRTEILKQINLPKNGLLVFENHR